MPALPRSSWQRDFAPAPDPQVHLDRLAPALPFVLTGAVEDKWSTGDLVVNRVGAWIGVGSALEIFRC
jgi:hypothetical protein